MMKYIGQIDVGPFKESEAEWLTERTLDSKLAYTSFEKFYRGDISSTQFLYLIQILSESLHSAYQEEQAELQRETLYETAINE